MSLSPIGSVLAALDERLDRVRAELPAQQAFLSTYRRTTVAVGQHVERGHFADAGWVERWDAAFADLYCTALDRQLAGEPPARPWRLAFSAPPRLHPLLHVLLSLNAHVNYDLPQSLLAVVSDEDFADPATVARRSLDHQRVDGVLASRVAAEDQELGPDGRRLRDRLLTPVNRLASQRFLREGRQQVWHNTLELQAARLRGPEAYAARLAELEVLTAAKIADLLRPGPVLLRLAVAGFGVTLPPAADPPDPFWNISPGS